MNRVARLLPALLAVALALTGCAGASAAESRPGAVRVVAATDVWGDVVQRIGGAHVAVTSIIDDPAKDPHEYEAGVRDRLAVARADLVVENGGGYDAFMERLRSSNRGVAVVSAAAVSGYAVSAATFNEHLWYDLPTVRRVAAAVAAVLQRRDPAHRADYAAALASFGRRLDALMREEDGVRRIASGRGVAVTEPVPLYLTTACGLVDRTPRAFSSAVEDGRDVPPAALQQELALLTQHRVALLAVNVQTAEPTTDQVVAAARAAGIPVVAFRETLPEGQDYPTWIAHQLAAVRAAVDA